MLVVHNNALLCAVWLTLNAPSSVSQSKTYIYPRMFSIHDMTTDTGLPCDNADEDCPTAGPNQVRLPSILNLSYER